MRGAVANCKKMYSSAILKGHHYILLPDSIDKNRKLTEQNTGVSEIQLP